jgi:hypothetical protein
LHLRLQGSRRQHARGGGGRHSTSGVPCASRAVSRQQCPNPHQLAEQCVTCAQHGVARLRQLLHRLLRWRACRVSQVLDVDRQGVARGERSDQLLRSIGTPTGGGGGAPTHHRAPQTQTHTHTHTGSPAAAASL